MTLHLRHEVLQLGLRDPFRIARSDHDAGHAVTTVIVDVRDDRWPDVAGLGEGYPDRFYGDTVATMAAVFPLLLDAVGQLEPTRAGPVAAGDRMAQAIAHHGGAKCALDIALHDLVGQVTGQGMADLLDLHGPIPPTDFTLDPLGRVTRTTEALHNVSTTVYDAAGNVIERSGPAFTMGASAAYFGWHVVFRRRYG